MRVTQRKVAFYRAGNRNYAAMRLKDYIIANSLRYADVAKQVSTCPAVIWRYAHDQRLPSLEMVIRIHRATNGAVTAADFMPPDLPPPISLAA